MRAVAIAQGLLVAAILLSFSGPARADAARDVLLEVSRCAGIADAASRLACFDAAVPRARSAIAEGERQEASKGGLLEWFGFARPRKPVTTPEGFGKPAPRDGAERELDQITATVVDFAKTLRGRALFVLDNGQIWRQLDADDTPVRDPSPGTPMKVTIEKGFLGSYNLTVDGRNPLIKVFRLK